MTLAIGHLSSDSIGVLDAVLEIRAPFDPSQAVKQCVELLNRFGVKRVIGDRYAGEWPVARFAEHGIAFEQSARPKSDIYHDLLPLLNAKRVELLEHPRLKSQLVGLERRTARSGKDSIDHTPGGHDDIANAVAGLLVGLDLDRMTSVAFTSYLNDNAPVPTPRHARSIGASIALSADGGTVAITYWAKIFAKNRQDNRLAFEQLVLLDFETIPFATSIYENAMRRLVELHSTTGGM